MYNKDSNDVNEAIEYLKNRSIQLLKYDIFCTNIQITNFGVITDYIKTTKFGDNITESKYFGAYIFKDYRGRKILKEVSKSKGYFINLPENQLYPYLFRAGIKHTTSSVEYYNDTAYRGIVKYLGNKKVESTPVYQIHKVEYGLAILNWMNANKLCQQATCIMPKIYDDKDLAENWQEFSYKDDIKSMLLAMETKNLLKLNSVGKTSNCNLMQISNLKEVNDMLIATAIKNFFIFERHKEMYARPILISQHFSSWLNKFNCWHLYSIFKQKLETIDIFDNAKQNKILVE